MLNKFIADNQHDLIAIYLDYINNFITLKGFADYYGVDDNIAYSVIALGRELYNKQFNIK